MTGCACQPNFLAAGTAMLPQDVVRAHYEGLLDAFAECVRDNKDAKTLRVGLCGVIGGELLKPLIDRFGNLGASIP